MELKATIQGLASLSDASRVHVVLDSQYVVNGATEWLSLQIERDKRSAGRSSGSYANSDLWRQLAEQLSRHEVDFEWVRGHSGHPGNEYVDQLASSMIEWHLEQQRLNRTR